MLLAQSALPASNQGAIAWEFPELEVVPVFSSPELIFFFFFYSLSVCQLLSFVLLQHGVVQLNERP